MITLGGTAIGIFLSIPHMPIDPEFFTVIQKIIMVIIFLSTTAVASKVIVSLAKISTQETEQVFPSTSIFITLIRIVIYSVGALIILQYLGISIAPILTAMGIGGLAVALALQNTLSNLFAGIHIVLSKQVKTGDYIKLDTGEEGFVVDISWRNTTVQTIGKNLIIIPNSRLASSILTNFSLPEKSFSMAVQIRIDYESDLEKVELITLETARETMKEFYGEFDEKDAPVLRFNTFADFGIDLTVYLFPQTVTDQYRLRHEFIKKIYNRYKKEGIKIPFPISTVYVEDKSGNFKS